MGRYDHNKLKKTGRYHDNNGAIGRQSVRASNKGINISIVIILIIIAAAAGFFGARLSEGDLDADALIKSFFAKKSEPPSPESEADEKLILPQPQTSVAPVASFDNIQQLQPRESVILPELDSSDEQIREALTAVTPELAQWLDTDQLIRKYMVIANDFAQGLRVAKHLSFLKLEQPFTVEQNGAGLFIASVSYQRYNNLAQAINAIDIPATVSVYQKFRPLLLQVFAEFSYPDGHNLDDIFIKASEEILTAPVIDEPVAVVKSPLHYRFVDPELEALNPVHKQMLRMGAENTRVIQHKVRMLAEALVNSKD